MTNYGYGREESRRYNCVWVLARWTAAGKSGGAENNVALSHYIGRSQKRGRGAGQIEGSRTWLSIAGRGPEVHDCESQKEGGHFGSPLVHIGIHLFQPASSSVLERSKAIQRD